MSDHLQQQPFPQGLGLDDLPLINRALFDHAVRAAMDVCDPCRESQAFIEALWTALASAFEWTPQPWPQEVSPPKSI